MGTGECRPACGVFVFSFHSSHVVVILHSYVVFASTRLAVLRTTMMRYGLTMNLMVKVQTSEQRLPFLSRLCQILVMTRSGQQILRRNLSEMGTLRASCV